MVRVECHPELRMRNLHHFNHKDLIKVLNPRTLGKCDRVVRISFFLHCGK